jgi:hypothetical protein
MAAREEPNHLARRYLDRGARRGSRCSWCGEAVHLISVSTRWLVNLDQHRLAQGCPNRNPEHERKCGAPSQQDADDNPAMPTAKFGTRKFFHWFTDAEGSTERALAEVEARRPKYTIHLMVNLSKVTTISLPGWSPYLRKRPLARSLGTLGFVSRHPRSLPV